MRQARLTAKPPAEGILCADTPLPRPTHGDMTSQPPRISSFYMGEAAARGCAQATRLVKEGLPAPHTDVHAT